MKMCQNYIFDTRYFEIAVLEISRVDCSYFSVLFVTGSPGKPQTPAFELDPNGRLVTLVWVDGHSGDYPIYGHRILLKAEGKDALIFSLPVQRHSIASAWTWVML